VRVLVTGGNGFVGRHLCSALRARGFDLVAGVHDPDGVADPARGEVSLELRDSDGLRESIERVRPDLVFHLAAEAFVPAANRDPMHAFDINALGTARLLEAIRNTRRDSFPRVIYASSAEVYGIRERSELPLKETLAAHPATPYAASKLSGEAIALAWRATYGIPAIVARAFNHIGPGQDERFAVASFAHGLAAVAEGASSVLTVGNLSAERDFLDVRDVVAAYVALAERGQDGEVYNVCSGRPVAMQEILRQLIAIAHVPVEVRQDPARLRPSDIPISFGDNAKLRDATGWSPQYPLSRSLADVYADARERLALAG